MPIVVSHKGPTEKELLEMQNAPEFVEEEPEDPLLLLEGYSQSDLDTWLQSPFLTLFNRYLGELGSQMKDTLLDGTVAERKITVPGYVFPNDDALRGALAIIAETSAMGDILAEYLKEANENLRDKRESEVEDV